MLIELVTYDGWCRDDSDSEDVLGARDENTFEKCKENCYSNEKCTAFSYESPKDSSYRNCIFSKGGPYTKGSGRNNTKCYLPQRRKFVVFYIYINKYQHIEIIAQWKISIYIYFLLEFKVPFHYSNVVCNAHV